MGSISIVFTNLISCYIAPSFTGLPVTVNSSKLSYCSLFYWTTITSPHSAAPDFSWQWWLVTRVSAPYCPNSPTFTLRRADLPIQIPADEQEHQGEKNNEQNEVNMILISLLSGKFSSSSKFKVDIFPETKKQNICDFCILLSNLNWCYEGYAWLIPARPSPIHWPVQPFIYLPPIVRRAVSLIFLSSQFPISSHNCDC